MHKMDNLRWYVGKIALDLAKNNWDIFFKKHKYVYSGDASIIPENRCGGFVDDSGLELQIATGRKLENWVSNLIHEYQHFRQWADAKPSWRERNSNNYDVSMDTLEDWTKGKNFKINDLWKSAHRIVRWEADAELRAISDINRYALPLDISLYIRQATAYMLSYGFVVVERKWPNPRITDIPEIYAELPSTTEILEDLYTNKGVKKHYWKYRKLFSEYACKPWNKEEDG